LNDKPSNDTHSNDCQIIKCKMTKCQQYFWLYIFDLILTASHMRK
jgi:hypothetical protein